MDVAALIDDIARQIAVIPGMAAVVLGGSRAAGTYTAASDLDIGIYYRDAAALDTSGLRRVAIALDDEHREDALTPIGGWGPWINGGWLTVQGQAVDLLYRNLGRVAQYVEAAVAGEVEVIYQWGHPHGFLTTIYAAEVASCKLLWEREQASHA